MKDFKIKQNIEQESTEKIKDSCPIDFEADQNFKENNKTPVEKHNKKIIIKLKESVISEINNKMDEENMNSKIIDENDINFPSHFERNSIKKYKLSYKRVKSINNSGEKNINKILIDENKETLTPKNLAKVSNPVNKNKKFSQNDLRRKSEQKRIVKDEPDIVLPIIATKINQDRNYNKTSNNFHISSCTETKKPRADSINCFGNQNPLNLSFGEINTNIVSPTIKPDKYKANKINSIAIEKLLKCIDDPKEKEKEKIKIDKVKENTKKSICIDLFKSKKIKTVNQNINIVNKQKHAEKLSDEKVKDNRLNVSNLELRLKDYHSVKCSKNEVGEYIKCYAVNTYKGIVKKYNEDKVSMILSIAKPKNFDGKWPKASYIALYDGTHGKVCCDFLRDELHNYIIKNANFPQDPKKSIIEGFKNAETEFIKKYNNNENKDNTNEIEKSGACILITLFIDDKIYIANCGDSKAILSLNKGNKFQILNNVHIPNKKINQQEYKRITENGGIISKTKNGKEKIKPGNLTCTRGLGFLDIKQENPNLILSSPEINEISIDSKSFDFIILLSSGVFEKYSDQEILKSVYNIVDEQKKLKIDNLHKLAGASIDMILKTALLRGSLENVTGIFLGFKNFNKNLKESSSFTYNTNMNEDDISNKKVSAKFASISNHNSVKVNNNENDANNGRITKEKSFNENLNKINEEIINEKIYDNENDVIYEVNKPKFTIKKFLENIKSD